MDDVEMIVAGVIALVIVAIIGWLWNQHQWALRNAKYGPVKGYNDTD